VWHEPGISQAGVANLLDMETISVVRLVDSLEQAELLQRRPHASDRRVWTLWLTPVGENAIVEVQRINDKVRGEALAGVSDDDRERLLDTLMQLRTNLLQAAEADQQEAA
jgi:MarR family transcriptional regulator for hemolysin